MKRRPSLIIAAALLLAAGCGGPSAPTSDDPLGAAPDDLTIELMTLMGPDASSSVELERVVLFPDGSLHYGRGPDPASHERPRRTRILDRRQTAEVWSTLTQLGLAEPSAGAPPVLPSSVEVPRDELVHLLFITARDERWMVVDRVRGADRADSDSAVATVARMLASLAWAGEGGDPEVVVTPRRYDLGPDPYARYRRP